MPAVPCPFALLADSLDRVCTIALQDFDPQNRKFDFIEVKDDALYCASRCLNASWPVFVLTVIAVVDLLLQVMVCPAGCIGGGGQPRSRDPDVLKHRMKGRGRIAVLLPHCVRFVTPELLQILTL